MCGIFAILNDQTNNASQTVLDGLKKLEYRGYDSWGIAIKPISSTSKANTELMVEKHIGKIGEAKTTLPQSSIGLGHTRWATHGGVTDFNAHPHLDCQKQIAVVHNGIFENYLDFKKQLIKNGHQFLSETDTEVIAHLIEEKLKKTPLIKAVFQVFNQLQGSNAIAGLDSASQSIIACRNGSPLVVGIDEKNQQYFLGSDVPAFLKFTNQVYFLDDGEGVVISKKGIQLFDLKTEKEKKLTFKKLDLKLEDAEKGGYPHFLIKEITEQQQTIEKTSLINKDEILKIAQLINKEKYLPVFLGCGSAFYCGLSAKYLFSFQNIDVPVYGAYEFLPFSKMINKKSLVFAISQSGETADTLIAVKQAKNKGAKIVAVVNARGSTLERLADFVLPVGAGPEIAVVSTKAFTAQLSTLYLVSKAIENKYSQGKKLIKNFSQSLKKLFDSQFTNQLKNLAKSLKNEKNIFLIGKYANYPASLEFALKLKETAYIHAEAFASGELKHGVLTLIEKDTVCFVLASNDETKQEILSSAAQLKARGGKIIGVAPFEAQEFDIFIKTPDAKELTILGNIIVGQLLSYYIGVEKGLDPDKPRNLAKSVTVK